MTERVILGLTWQDDTFMIENSESCLTYLAFHEYTLYNLRDML